MKQSEHGISMLKILPWIMVFALAGLLAWVAQDPKKNGDELQSYLPQELHVRTPPNENTQEPAQQIDKSDTWQPVIDTQPKINPDTPAPINSYHDAVSRASVSVVNIYTTQKASNIYAHDPVLQQFFEYYGQGQEHSEGTSSLGSGVIVSEDGYIVTNAHVIERAHEIVVALADGRKSKATVVGSDTDSDLAVIKITLDNLTPLAFRKDAINVGDVALAIGNPFGVGQTVTQGIISATGRAGLGISTFEDFIQTDAAINPGNSGGALVDANGALVGINTVIYSRSGGSMGIGFAIPTSIVEQVMNSLITHGKVSRGWLGVGLAPTPINPTDLTKHNGVTIANVMPNGPADNAGIKAGDVIISIDGTQTTDPNTLVGIVSKKSPNSTLNTMILRDGVEQTLSITVGERPTQQTVQAPTQRQLTPQESERLNELLRHLQGR